VLKPGGRFAVSDMVILGDKSKLSAETVRSVEPWARYVSGALEKQEYEALLRGQASRTSPSRSRARTMRRRPRLGPTVAASRAAVAAQRRSARCPDQRVYPGPETGPRVSGMARRKIEVLEENGVHNAEPNGAGEAQVERSVALGRALSDPIRVRMFGMLAAEAAEGRGCCGLPGPRRSCGK
jgi:hypothetical protein